MEHNKMFCFQCEQTAGCTGCTGNAGVCGKTADVANLQDELTGALIGLARATDGDTLATTSTWKIMIEGLFTTITNVNFNAETIRELIQRVHAEKEALVPMCSNCGSPCGRNNDYDMALLWNADENIRSLKSLILFGIRGVAAYAYHANLICVKDFSRFSRDYIETGNYLECTFPFMGVRFISINDGYDSDDYKGTTGGLEVVMRSIIYAAYSKDLSVKTTSAKIQMMKQGKYVGGYAPYGYVLHPTIRNKLAVDPEAADVIRRIFREALEGSNTSQIARSLNDEGIPTPGQYFKSKHPDKKKFSNMSEKISWETVMVYNILKNLVYTGTLVSRKMKSCGVGSKKRVVNEPIIVEGTHEAIISKEDFELAQKVIRGGGRNPTRKQHDYPLKGLVRCGNCKRAMTRRKNKAGIRYFQCIHSVNNGNTDCPVGRSFPEMDIEKVVFHALTQFLALAQKEAIQNREVGDLRKSAIKECADKIRTLQKQNEQHKASKLRLYEKYAAGSITKEAYIQQKAAADVKIAENDGVIQRSHERMKELDSETACSDEKLDAVCEQYADCKALTYELTHAFISAVYIYDLYNIEIVWKFKDFLTTSEGEAK